jgi:hypothetical protein
VNRRMVLLASSLHSIMGSASVPGEYHTHRV